ncbi:unnamed protein product [Mytilus edulis]|uniref:LRRNT domain-containing protein n=1 Tax=Mytilus edulis TaxID=6550 RepID=A0A8S3TE62_MYTED|nr:unnamed protein product [Mytilus edulis]
MDIIVIFVFAVVSTGLVKGTCPSTCSCVDDSSGSKIYCNSKYLGRIPALPNDTYYLELGFNNITEIDIQFCKEMPQLQYLYLHYNEISVIEPFTFVDLPNLHYLYLHYNEISVIEPFTFVDLPNLRYLTLSNNKIRSLVSYTFINLTNLYEL